MQSPTSLSVCERALEQLDVHDQFELLSKLFVRVSAHDVPSDFLRLAAMGMLNLRSAGRYNVIYLLAKAVGTMRVDDSDTLLPVKRMPMGLIEYVISFFTASSVQKVWL